MSIKPPFDEHQGMSMNRIDSAEALPIPNETTIQAMKDARAGRVSGRFATVAELLAEMNVDDTPDVQQGSTNVYADLGFPDADEMLVKALLVTKICEAIKTRKLSSDHAAAALGLMPAASFPPVVSATRSRNPCCI